MMLKYLLRLSLSNRMQFDHSVAQRHVVVVLRSMHVMTVIANLAKQRYVFAGSSGSRDDVLFAE